MIDPNQGASPEALDRLRQESFERTQVQIIQAIEKQLEDYQMTWDDLAAKLQWPFRNEDTLCDGQIIKQLAGDVALSIVDLNDIAAVFSAEVYIIFRPRFPWIPKR